MINHNDKAMQERSRHQQERDKDSVSLSVMLKAL
jgi:hypothetical protein